MAPVPRRPHPLNAPGPFYVVDGCCTACGVPAALAPELYAYDKSDHCYVKRQPVTPEETDQAQKVMMTQELDCIRYRGTDAQILRRLADAGARDQCDAPTVVVPVLRNHVSFVLADPRAHAWSAIQVLEDFASYLRGQRLEYRTTPIVKDIDEAYFSISWFQDDFHRVAARSIDRKTRQWLVHHSFIVGLSDIIDGWLSQGDTFDNVQWCSEAQWRAGTHGQRRPW